MALSESSLSGKIKSEIESLYGTADDSQKLQDFCDALAAAIVDEITNNAEVTVTGVTSGPSSATGTIS
jgi:hypothetical protein